MALSSEKSRASNFNKPNVQYCRYCEKECKNINSLKQHECRCNKNPNKINTVIKNFNQPGTRKAWNKGLTKETDSRLAEQSIKISLSRKGKPGRKHTEEEKQKLREKALKQHFGGFNMRRGIYYNGIKLDSSYEVIVAESLDKNNILWERPGRFLYHMDGIIHYYTPDFYLPDYNVYLDPKNDFLIENINPGTGYKDIDKIRQVELENNVKILILNKDQLSWEYIKTMLS